MIIAENKGKKICIWKNEKPCEYMGEKRLDISLDSGGRDWYNGTICMEVKLHPRHISNYAMICMKYTPRKKAKADISIYSNSNRIEFVSKVLPFGRCIHIGLLREFEEAIEDFFYECPKGDLPNGDIEILYGGFDEVGSSKNSFKKAMELLVYVFQHIERISEKELGQMVLERM